MKNNTKNEVFMPKMDQKTAGTSSIPALGTSKTASISNRSGFSVLGAKAAPKFS